jgi:hypothetical protein
MEMVESNKMHKEGKKAQPCVMRIRGMGMVRNIPTGGKEGNEAVRQQVAQIRETTANRAREQQDR